jgi:hypothetical protein
MGSARCTTSGRLFPPRCTSPTASSHPDDPSLTASRTPRDVMNDKRLRRVPTGANTPSWAARVRIDGRATRIHPLKGTRGGADRPRCPREGASRPTQLGSYEVNPKTIRFNRYGGLPKGTAEPHTTEFTISTRPLLGLTDKIMPLRALGEKNHRQARSGWRGHVRDDGRAR